MFGGAAELLGFRRHYRSPGSPAGLTLPKQIRPHCSNISVSPI